MDKEHLMDIETTLKAVMSIDGAVGAALVDQESGMALGVAGGGPFLDLELAAAGNTEVVRAQNRTIRTLELGDDIEDILITLGRQYHLIRLLRPDPSSSQPSSLPSSLFLYLALDRSQSNLAMARHELRRIEHAIVA